MADYNINAVTRRVVFSGSAGVGPYAFTFEILAQTDIAVYKNSTKLVLTTDYTVTINANGTGSVTLVVAATGSDTITIIGSRAIERTTDFVTAGDLLASSLNEQLDSQIVMIQQLAEENKRAIKAPAYDPADVADGGTANLTLPAVSTRAGKFLSFDANGNPTATIVESGSIVIATTADQFTGDGTTTNFTLSVTPISGNLTDVYIDGIYQNKSTFSFVGTTLTFSEAPPLGASIEVVSNVNAVSGTLGSSGVSYTQGGVGAVSRTVQNRLRDFVSVKDFGAVGDGVTDDTAALTNAIAAQAPLYFGDDTYKITAPIAQTLTKDVLWEGRGATISYENPSHTEYAIRLSDTTGVDIVINNLTIDGTKQANKILEVLNNTSNATSTNFVANELRVDNCKRLNTATGGSAIHLRGAFEDITFNGGWVKTCELPTGQGTPGTVGITGIAVDWYSDTSYARRVTLNGTLIEKVYSSDLSYTSDQDGFLYFAPNISGGTSGKVESDCVVMGGSRFVNCYGRSIKTQVRNTVVRDSHFQRTEGLTGGVGNTEIIAQTGSAVIDACTFSYSNSQQPGTAVGVSTSTGWKSSAMVSNCEVYLESGTTLNNFVGTFPASVVDPWTRLEVMGNKVFGTVTALVNFLTNAVKGHLTVSDNWVEELGIGTTSERCLIYVSQNGSSPWYAYIAASNNVYAGSNTVYLVRDQVPSVAMDASVSAFGNFGFVNNWNAQVNDPSDPLSAQAIATKITGLEASGNKGYFGMQTKVIGASATETFNYRNANASLIIMQAENNEDCYALFSVSSTTQSISVGSAVALGTTTNPGTGSEFNIWRSGTGEISIEHVGASSRVVSVWVFSPN